MRTELIQPAAGRKLTVSGMYLTRTDISVPGWYQEGDKWYYFQENGAMAHDTDVDGYHLGSDGVMQ